VVDDQQVQATMERMARDVDHQNVGDPNYQPMAPAFADSIPFQAALSLVRDGRNQANGYTEAILRSYRRRQKVAGN